MAHMTRWPMLVCPPSCITGCCCRNAADSDPRVSAEGEGRVTMSNPSDPTPETDALARLEATWREKAGTFKQWNEDIRATLNSCADDLAALRRTLQDDQARQSSSDVPGATGSPRSPQPDGSGPRWRTHESGDVVCEHGTAIDVHCCGCHSGFLFDSSKCVCF